MKESTGSVKSCCTWESLRSWCTLPPSRCEGSPRPRDFCNAIFASLEKVNSAAAAGGHIFNHVLINQVPVSTSKEMRTNYECLAASMGTFPRSEKDTKEVHMHPSAILSLPAQQQY